MSSTRFPASRRFSLATAVILASTASVALAQPGNDFCNAPAPISGTGSFFFTTIGASTDGPPLAGIGAGTAFNDVWFCWTASATGRVAISTCGSTSLDTVLAVYPQCGCLGFSQSPVASNDDACGTQSRVEVDVLSGNSYFIRLGTYLETQAGAGNLNITQVVPGTSSDVCSGAFPLSLDTPQTFSLSNATSGLPSELPVPCGDGRIYRDIWFAFTPDFTAPYFVSTCAQTTADTVLAAYAGPICPTGSQQPLACNDDACGVQSKLVMPAQAGTPYFIRLGGYSPSTTGSGTLTVSSALVAGPITDPIGGGTYYLIDAMSYADASASAIAMGGHLATVSSAAENTFIRNNVLKFDGTDRIGWLGLTDQATPNAFAWSTGEPLVYTNWAAQEPVVSATANFATLVSASGQWAARVGDPAIDRIFGIVELGAPPAPACPADVVTDGVVDGNDFIAFINSFAIGDPAIDPAADLNADGVIDGNDFIAFINSFALGC